MNVFTTINPKGNFESQEEALRSWASKYEVISVNHAEEIESAKERFPFVRFVESEGSFDYLGKNLVPLNSILKAIKKEGERHCAIVNSDIILEGSMNIPAKNIDGGLVIATRWELDGQKETYPFSNGYDLFIFERNNADLFMNSRYVIGMPWWDFWIPSIAIKAGMKVSHIKSKKIFHRTHETNYDGDVWISFGENLYRDLMVGVMNNPIDLDVFNFCNGVKSFIEKHQKEIKIK